VEQVTIHASTIAFVHAGRAEAVILAGVSGSGKSSVALELMALGAQLVSDDQTCLHRDGAALIATAPERLTGLIEWRGVGLIPAQALAQAQAVVWVDLDQPADGRLPDPEWIEHLGIRLPRLRPPRPGPIASALCQYMRTRAWLRHGDAVT